MNMSKLTFGSVCSGIEAASMAWNPLGWKASWLAEIEPFPSAVLKHHYPDTPNYGDMTLLPDMVLTGEIEAPDVLVGGTPCQSFSVAGMRGGLSDERGQLTIKYVELANAIDTIRRRDGKDESIIVWENVPGVLSSKDNAFGCFIAALAGGSSEARSPGGGRWANAGYVLGPERAVAWRVLDAQYFGLAQRRKRVFVVASARNGFDPTEILFEFDGVRRDIAPSRKAGEEIAGNVGAGFTPSSFGGYRTGVGTLRANGGDLGGGSETLVTQGFRKLTFESYAQDETASTMMARDHKSYTDLVAYGIPGNWIGRKPENGGNSTQFMHEVAPAQTATDKHGVVAFAQNTRDEVRYIGGDGQIAGALSANPGMKQTTYIATSGQESLTPWEQQGRRIQGVNGVSPTIMCNPVGGMKLEPILAFNSRQDPVSGDVFGALDTSSPQAQAVAYGCTPTKLNDVANTVTASYGQGGVDLETKPLALVATDRQGVLPINTMTVQGRPSDDLNPRMGSGIGKPGDPQNTLTKAHMHGVFDPTIMCVRRLTPIECERLQGFPDGFTMIPWRNKSAEDCPDGHRYKALGNSMAVPVMRWIGERIKAHL